MKKSEVKILMNEYRIILESEALGYNKEAEKNLLERLIKAYGLIKEMYETINNHLIEMNDYDVITKDLFEMMEDSFSKYNVFIKYDVDFIEEIYEDLQYELSDEDNHYYNIRINQLKNRLNKNK